LPTSCIGAANRSTSASAGDHRQGKRFAQQTGAFDVHAGLFVAAQRRGHKPIDGLFMCPADFGGLLADFIFEISGVVALFEAQLPAFQRAVHLADQFLTLDGFHQVAPGAVGQGRDGGFCFTHAGHH
jgi:hypothetical protein